MDMGLFQLFATVILGLGVGAGSVWVRDNR